MEKVRIFADYMEIIEKSVSTAKEILSQVEYLMEKVANGEEIDEKKINKIAR